MAMEYDIQFNECTGDSHEYDVMVDDEIFETTVTHDPRKVKKWIREIENRNHRRLHRLIVGLDVEWRPNTIPGQVNPVAILQLFVSTRCLIYQFLGVHLIPKRLKKFLRNTNYTFVGVGIEQDKQKLFSDYSLEVTKTRDLREMAAYELEDPDLCRVGLRKLAKVILGIDADYKEVLLKVRTSDWDRDRLSKKQVLYACLDAYLSFEIGRQLHSWYD